MGWISNHIYGGDGTQTTHYSFIEWAKIGISSDEMMEYISYKTVLPPEKWKNFCKNIKKVLQKMPQSKFWNEYRAIEWQMLGALYLDNKTKLPKIIKKNAILATEYLMQDHASEFSNPSNRRRVLKKFIEKIKQQ